jgi:mRNA interferase HigB
MNVISIKAIRKFTKKHANSRASLNGWYKVALKANWKSFDDLKKTLPTADIYGRCVIFDIGGNNYRLIASIDYPAQQLYIKAILTHAEYDKQKWKGSCKS